MANQNNVHLASYHPFLPSRSRHCINIPAPPPPITPPQRSLLLLVWEEHEDISL